MEMIGKKTQEDIEPGYVWAPYVPVQKMVILPGRRMRAMHDLWGFPLGNNTASMVSSRYSINKVNSSYYGTIEVKKEVK